MQLPRALPNISLMYGELIDPIEAVEKKGT